ncbi:hypothetical protein DL96DRAFT_77611 [Flagelloscypha sp. PMI_526]|nr:hypothetical protein DL96DRAFT_77611 [Flagelloscypha sp. PMI_526]
MSSPSTEANPQGTIQLNNYLQGKSRLTVLSWLESTEGERHAPTHICVAKINGEARGTGTASRKYMCVSARSTCLIIHSCLFIDATVFRAKDDAALQALEWLKANEGSW